MSEFKVGDKVCDPVFGLNGAVNNIDIKRPFPVIVDFDSEKHTCDSYSLEGKWREDENIVRLQHGHMEPGTGKVTFTPKKEPFYEWQWVYSATQTNGSVNHSTTGFFKSEEEAKSHLTRCLPGFLKLHSIIEESKREVKP